jgi:hypothetical protein
VVETDRESNRGKAKVGKMVEKQHEASKKAEAEMPEPVKVSLLCACASYSLRPRLVPFVDVSTLKSS